MNIFQRYDVLRITAFDFKERERKKKLYLCAISNKTEINLKTTAELLKLGRHFVIS